MIQRQKWIDHKFQLGIDNGWTENILTRLTDTEKRLEAHSHYLSNEELSKSFNNTWSIKQHIGHLTDLEALWSRRFLDFVNGRTELQLADMSNKKTQESNHNEQAINVLIQNFRIERKKLLKDFSMLDSVALNHKAMHPRIKMPMRPVDLLFFIAEHDNHHISSIIQIKNDL